MPKRRILARVQVGYWRCMKTEAKGAWLEITSGRVETTRVHSSGDIDTEGQRCDDWIGGCYSQGELYLITD